MKCAILQCDQVMGRFVPEFGQYPDMIREMFAEVKQNELSITFDIYDCQLEEYPECIDDYDFYITTGSKASVYDEDPWIKGLIGFVQRLYQTRKRLIGICFGHQIIAMALGGEVQKSSRGWGVGVATNRVTQKTSWMTDDIQYLNILVSHQDQITRLPDDALVIAESDFCPFFVVQWGSSFLSIQGHPEWQRNYSQTLINERRKIIPSIVVEQGLDSLSKDVHSTVFIQWALDFIKQ